MKFVPITLLLFIQLVNPLFAQESVSSAGQSDTISGTQIDWNVGETVIMTNQLSTGFVTQGLEQPHFVLTSIESFNKLELEVSLYPNPASRWVNIDLKNLPSSELELLVFDMTGSIIRSYEIGELKNTIDLSDLEASTYILILESKDQLLREKYSLVISH